MSLKSELDSEVAGIFADQWAKRDGAKIPESEDLKLGNDAVRLDATVLYADLSGSTAMVDLYPPAFCAEVYKAFLHCSAKLIRAEGGVITAYDGDRIMGVFIGARKNSAAATCALKINGAVSGVVQPALKSQYPGNPFVIRHVVGVDTSPLFVARTGVRGANDLVWVGAAANYAAKLTECDASYPSWITHRVFDVMNDQVKSSQGRAMWEARSWTNMGGLTVYRSNWTWPV